MFNIGVNTHVFNIRLQRMHVNAGSICDMFIQTKLLIVTWKLNEEKTK